jgi:hypothetical protein
MKLEETECSETLAYIKFRRRKITQKETYNIQNTAKVWNQVGFSLHDFIKPTFLFVLPSLLRPETLWFNSSFNVTYCL